MYRIKLSLLFCISIVTVQLLEAQKLDSSKTFMHTIDSTHLKTDWNYTHQNKFPIKQLILPGAMIAYGFTTLGNEELQEVNAEVKDEVYAEKPHTTTNIDNYLQFVPAAAVYALNAVGIKGKNNFRDRTMIYTMSNIIMGTTVYTLKKTTHQIRPDGSSYTSFPSGHTAEAFASAEFLFQEYKDVSIWYGIAGYAVAATTGYLRLYNNKHWLGDVVAGAGIGIASTKVSYWLYPKLKRLIFKDKAMHTIVMPTYRDGSFGVGMVHQF